LILLRVPKRRQTLGAQKNQRHAPCPQKSNRTAVGLSRPSTRFLRNTQPTCRMQRTALAYHAINSLRGGAIEGRGWPGQARTSPAMTPFSQGHQQGVRARFSSLVRDDGGRGCSISASLRAPAKQSRFLFRCLDCFVAFAPRNDRNRGHDLILRAHIVRTRRKESDDPVRSRIEHDHAAYGFAGFHRGEAFVDFGEFQLRRNPVLQM